MEEQIKEWQQKYSIDNIKLVGYRGGYPMFAFDKRKIAKVSELSKRQLDKIVRSAEMTGGMELGVGMNFRKTAGIIVENETIVIYGHVAVIGKMLFKLIQG